MNSIRAYGIQDSASLFALLQREGDEWGDYWHDANKQKYEHALAQSIVYVLYEDDELCGYARCRDDDGYGMYIYDLLVDRSCRKKGYGRALIEHVSKRHSEMPLYILSDADTYYKKQGYKQAGSIFVVE